MRRSTKALPSIIALSALLALSCEDNTGRFGDGAGSGGSSAGTEGSGGGGTGGAGEGGAGAGGSGSGGDAGSQGLSWYRSCGDPVCGPTPMDIPDLDNCTDERAGETCAEDGASCDPVEGCGVRLVCAASDPRMQPGGCPISRARFKRDIHYLSPAERARLADELLALPLATYRYRQDPSGRQQLGFIIEDAESSPAADAPRDRVDLYGYTSQAVAAIQQQAQELHALQSEVETLRAQLDTLAARCGPENANR